MSDPATGATIRMWRQPDGLWRWRWVYHDAAGEERESLTSNLAFESAAQAEQSAREAYPDVPVVPPHGREHRRRRRPRRLLPRTLVLLAVAALAYRLGRRHVR